MRREQRDGRRVVVKDTPYDARVEAEGLARLRDAGARVPEVVEATSSRLVLEEVRGDGDWAACGARLAGVHRVTGPAFGRDRDGVIGRRSLPGGRYDAWSACWWHGRVLPWLDVLPGGLQQRLRSAWNGGAVGELLDRGQPPSLVHGDLWNGNVVGGEWLIDPAAQHADRELDLAMAELFGGFPAAFWDGYDAAWPRDDGWRERLPAQQLHHRLLHVAQGWPAAFVGDALDQLGW